ncbi:hypothetical protein EDB92DRAFT_1856736 [Lactarius akahatsu]|uniref:C2H2-type domain-containing protein n=1 Tax=Lactarius akahatsu TaxID=416441 RepID=A0AAD4LHS1_9AGAM|nr:hypothetical protein EDB92DRAFT_1856736 [Lactarius akahatsu]
MGDQYPSLGPDDCLVQVEVHPVHPTARTAAPNHWGPCPPDLLWLLSHVISQETPLTISDATNPHTVWPQSVDGPMGWSPIPSQSRIPGGPSPLTLAPGTFNGSFGNLTESIPGCHARAGYNQHITIQEEQTRLSRCQPLEQGIDSSSNPGGLCCPCNGNAVPSDVCPTSQVPRQQWEELQEARQDPDTGSTWNSDAHSKAPQGMYHCTDCSKVYRRPQDLKRHTRDRHEWQRKCPFCRVRWSRPERIRAHLIKKHESRLTKDQQQEVRFLRGRRDTIRILEEYGNTTPHGSYTPD